MKEMGAFYPQRAGPSFSLTALSGTGISNGNIITREFQRACSEPQDGVEWVPGSEDYHPKEKRKIVYKKPR